MAPLHTGQASRLLGGGAREEESCASKRPLPLCAARPRLGHYAS